MPKARYTITTIVTSDEELVALTKEIRKHGFKHEDIYRAGLEAYKKIIDSNKAG